MKAANKLPENYQTLYDELALKIDEERLIIDPLRTLAYGTDASFYRLIPKIIVLAHNEQEVIDILAATSKLNIPVTYRAAGTSLSGQAITDSVLIVATHKWRGYEILEDAKKIRLQPVVSPTFPTNYTLRGIIIKYEQL